MAVLNALMAFPELDHFYLAEGTALALYYGHRKSFDLELFSDKDFQAENLVSLLEKNFPTFTNSRPNAVGIFGFTENIKVDFV